MLITIHNEHLSLTVDTLGAQMMSIRGADGCEYLWQGSPEYWGDRAPTLFPFIGRLWNNTYTFRGKTYHMGIHGFAAAVDFAPLEQKDDYVQLSISDTIASLVQYPFDFTLSIGYRLVKNTIEISYSVQNKGLDVMPFGIGGHPGFRVPLDPEERFEDYRLEFSQVCQPDRVGFTPAVYLNGHDEAFPLEEGNTLPLSHGMFDDDAIILKNMARKVTLRSAASDRSVTVSYPDMPFLGIWHWPKTDAPYVCIEPWSSLPGRQNVTEELSCKSDLIHLTPGASYHNTWTITIL